MSDFPLPACIRAALLAALMLLSSGPLHAQGVWSFEQVLQAALLNHPTIQGRRSAQDAARADLDGAKWQRYPTVSVEAPAGSTSSSSSSGLVRIEQPLWAGGRIYAGIDAAGSRVDAAGAALEEERLTLSLRVIAAYTEALRQSARRKFAEEGLAEHEKLLAMIKRRVDQSVSSQTDQRLAESRTYQASNDLSNANQALASSLAQLSQLTGKPVREVSDAGIAAIEPPLRDGIDAILPQALAYSPTLRRLEFEEQAAGSEIALQRSAYMPKLVVRLEKNTGNQPDIDNRARAMLVLVAQPGAGLSALAGVDAAVAKREAARSAREAAERDVRERFTLDWNEAEASRQRLGNAGQASATTTQVFESYARQYVIGRKTWNDVLNAVREATQAQFALEDTRAQAIAAGLRLAAETGNLGGARR
ncbi:TolC family protein [Janthinobacterium agaricidamnosum]|uniref:Outer membrane efflux family protein n=1 Tax=Janthinobacterium agaricidamnosum NBRC 102515 = DSM 9628 TaxID=1349767 RepID=W0V8R1_9BURK|nr:TolC family protein [Janthinobacterium agaricidamnosum]CDG83743.1 outer membrane efflux family protein [Janthinobacterium agaricidamnosum NBRC 102515 = DSM 9628]